MNRWEYSTVWKREGWAQRRRIFQTRKPAEARALVTQGRVAEAAGWDPDQDYDGTITFRERDAAKAKEMDLPPLEFVRVERRQVGAWEEIGNELQGQCDRTANQKLIDEDHCDECWEAWIEGAAPPHPKVVARTTSSVGGDGAKE